MKIGTSLLKDCTMAKSLLQVGEVPFSGLKACFKLARSHFLGLFSYKEVTRRSVIGCSYGKNALKGIGVTSGAVHHLS